MSQSKPKFKIVKRDVNPYKIIVESFVKEKIWKTQFTLEELEQQIAMLTRTKKELESKKMIEDAKIQNVKINHPEIDLNIDRKTRIAYAVVENSTSLIDEIDRKVKQINEQLKQDAEDFSEILKQTGIKLPEKDD